VADPVREEQRDRAALEQRFAFAAQDPEIDEAVGGDERRGAMHVAPLRSRPARLDRGP
jgi:hypothetical protein